MRRWDKEICDPDELTALLSGASVCRLGLWDGTWPYVVPLNFGYDDGTVYLHSAPEGRKLEILRQNDRVCIEVEAGVEVVVADVPCGSTTRYRSVIGFGRAEFLTDRTEKRRALEVIVRQCGGEPSALPDAAVDAVVVVRVALTELTGKRSPA